MPWRARDVRPLLLRRRASRPQLKRDPLGSAPAIHMRFVTFAVAILSSPCITPALNCQDTSITPCGDPTPNEPAWWEIKWQRQPDGSATGTVSKPPAVPRNLHLDRWAGRYRLTLITTAGTMRRDTLSAIIMLWVPKAPSGRKPSLIGATDSAFSFPYGAALAHPTWQRDPARPGISLLYDRAKGELTLVFGNGDLLTTDSGVFFDVFAIDSVSMRGRWVDGGLGVLVDSAGHSLGHPQGYFCLRRLNE